MRAGRGRKRQQTQGSDVSTCWSEGDIQGVTVKLCSPPRARDWSSERGQPIAVDFTFYLPSMTRAREGRQKNCENHNFHGTPYTLKINLSFCTNLCSSVCPSLQNKICLFQIVLLHSILRCFLRIIYMYT